MSYANAQNNLPSGPTVALGGRVEILPSTALPELNAPGGQAFAARAKGDAGADLMAIVCNTGMQPRTDIVNAMRNINHGSLTHLYESGVVYWPNDDKYYYAFAFERPRAPRMTFVLDEQSQPMSEDSINHYFVTPMISALSELLRTGVVHNAIRPDNIFWRIGGATAPQIGECMSTPAGVGQPILFETLERAMSIPLGRGNGSHTDDCYAFGVTLALLVLGTNPMKGMDDQTIIQTKSERGSFNALIGNRRLSASHIEILRGLLTDDARQRWTANDMEQWMSGRKLTPKNTDAGRRASRQMDFAGKGYWQMRPLAAALSNNVREAIAIIEGGMLDKWLRRAMNDEERADDLVEAQRSLKEGGKTTNYEDQLVTRTSIALDPTAPIRYRGLALMPAGIASLLVEAVINGQNLQTLLEIISTQLVTFWVDMQKDTKSELVPLAQQYERMRAALDKTSYGYGVERIIYELNTTLPCLSPMLRSHYVTSSKTLLPALERVAASGNRPHEPLDRHIAAFLVVRDRRSEVPFDAMSRNDGSAKRGLAMLTLYSELQSRHGPDALPSLAQWLVPLLEPAIQGYLGKGLREKLQKDVREVAAKGDLTALGRLINDPRRIEHDRQEFMAARMLYLNILKEINYLESRLADRNQVIQSTGKPMAASLSGSIAVVFVFAAIARAIWTYLM